MKYPYGHRNVIWTERGHRTLPLPVKPVPAAFQADTARLYDYLRRTGGICTLHTSASDQGTDWNDPHDPDLEPFVELFQGYHTSYEYYAATDNIILDVRLGEHLMGDEVRGGRPIFDVVVLGTAPLAVVEIFRGKEVVHVERPAGDEARFKWQDHNPLKGEKAAYYYVRVQQKDGNMAWRSPIWVHGAP